MSEKRSLKYTAESGDAGWYNLEWMGAKRRPQCKLLFILGPVVSTYVDSFETKHACNRRQNRDEIDEIEVIGWLLSPVGADATIDSSSRLLFP